MPRIIFKTYLSSGVTGVCRSSKGSAFLRPVPSGPHLGRYRPETLTRTDSVQKGFQDPEDTSMLPRSEGNRELDLFDPQVNLVKPSG